MYLKEDYKFYLNKNNDEFSFGETDNYIAKYNFKYLLKKQTSFLIGLENKLTKSNGSNILKKERNIFEYYALFHNKLFNKLTYNISARKGYTSAYKIPFIYSVDGKFDLTKNLNFRANYSTNYRIPTFNDLYWEFFGNENLIPETSNSAEFGIYFSNRKLNTSISIFQTKSDDLIQWRPGLNNMWRPINVQSVTSKGFEFDINYKYQINHHKIYFSSQYSYTKSTDNLKDKQLIYVPFHKAIANITYQYKSWSLNYNYQYNGNVFTTTSNTQYIDNFDLHNIQFRKEILKNTVNIGFYMNNLFNKNYQVVSYRPMPNRNYKLNINIKI